MEKLIKKIDYSALNAWKDRYIMPKLSAYMPVQAPPPETFEKPWGNTFYGLLILSSFIGLLYLLFDYTYHSKRDLQNINRSIADVTKKLATMKDSYYDLELNMSRFSQELPKIGGQIEVLEAIADAISCQVNNWGPSVPIPIIKDDLPKKRKGNLTKTEKMINLSVNSRKKFDTMFPK